jgi:hypothetical protein
MTALTSGSNELGRGGGQVKKVGKRLISCLPGAVLLNEGRECRLSDIIQKMATSRHMSPIFGILGERLCGVRGFATEAIAVAMAAGGKFRTPCKIRRETK